MPTAKTAAPTAKVQTTTIKKTVTDPVEEVVLPPAAPLPEPSEDFWTYIEALTEEDWKAHWVVLYRYPLGQPKPQKMGRYVRTYKATDPLRSEDQIFETFGGGQYDALLKGPRKDGQRGTTILAKFSWEMAGPEKNPWAAPAATPAAANTSELASTLQVVLQNLKQAQVSSPNAGESPAIKESISLIQQLTSAMPKPQGVAELVAALADLKKLTGGGDSGGGNSVVETIKVLKELGIIGAEPRKSMADELKSILEIAEMVQSGKTGGGGKRDWATSLIEAAPTILEKATPIAEKFAEAARSNAHVAELRAGVARPAAPGAPAAIPAAPAAPAAETGPRIVAPPETEPATAAAAPDGVQAPNLVWVKARAVQLFASGKTGDAIAEWLDSLDQELGNFLGSMDKERFAAFVKTDPILGQISTAPRFDQFVEEFVSYFTAEETEKS